MMGKANLSHSSFIATFASTFIIVTLAVSRRYYDRFSKLASTSFLLEDYILFISITIYAIFTGLSLYISVFLSWGSPKSDSDMPTIWKFYYISRLLMDLVMTTIRLDLFLFYRRIYRRVSTSCRSYCLLFMGLSAIYLVWCIVSRTLFCGVANATASFDYNRFILAKCDDKGVQISLIVGDLMLNGLVVGLIIKTVSIFRQVQTKVATNPIDLLEEASKPCRPMCIVAIIPCIVPMVHLKFASITGAYNYPSRIKGLLCSQTEACMLIFVSCMPMIRSLLFPRLKHPICHPENPRVKYASDRCRNPSDNGHKRNKSLSSLYKSVVTWSLIVMDTSTKDSTFGNVSATSPGRRNHAAPTNSPAIMEKMLGEHSCRLVSETNPPLSGRTTSG